MTLQSTVQSITKQVQQLSQSMAGHDTQAAGHSSADVERIVDATCKRFQGDNEKTLSHRFDLLQQALSQHVEQAFDKSLEKSFSKQGDNMSHLIGVADTWKIP